MEKRNLNSNKIISNDDKGKNVSKLSSSKGLDSIEKIRQEEKAKLELLKEKEREKTRLAVEKERARLEAELSREISELESQLGRTKVLSTGSQNMKPLSEPQKRTKQSVVTPTVDKEITKQEEIESNVATTTIKLAKRSNTDTITTKKPLRKSTSITKEVPIIDLNKQTIENSLDNIFSTRITQEVSEVEQEPVSAVLGETSEHIKDDMSTIDKVSPVEIQVSQVSTPETYETTDTSILDVKVVDEPSIDMVNVAPINTEVQPVENEALIKPTITQTKQELELENSSITDNFQNVIEHDNQDIQEVVENTNHSNIQIDPKMDINTPKELMENTLEEIKEPVKAENKKVVDKPLTPQQKEKAKLQAKKAKEKEREKARLALHKQKEKEKAALAKQKEKEKADALLTKQKEQELVIAQAKLAKQQEQELVKQQEQEELKVQQDQELAKQQEQEELKIQQDQELAKQQKQEELKVQQDQELAKQQEQEELILQQNVNNTEERVDAEMIAQIEKVEETEKSNIETIEHDFALAEEKTKQMTESKVFLASVNLAKTPEKTFVEENKKSESDLVDKSQATKAAINTLQKLREKIAAQKNLEKQLMEKEAIKAQEKTLQEKFNELKYKIEDDENYVSIEELQEERQRVSDLKQEKVTLEKSIDELNNVVERIINLEVNGTKVINPDTFEINPAFEDMGIDIVALNKTINEVEQELDSLTSYREEYSQKIIDAEKSYEELQTLYNQQESVINSLTDEIKNLKEQVNKEKEINKEVQLQLEKIQSEVKLKESTIHEYQNKLDEKSTSLILKNFENFNIFEQLDILREEIKKLMSKEELNKTKIILEEKEKEISALKVQLVNETSEAKLKQEMHTPYYACPQALFMPKMYAPYISVEKPEMDIYVQEIRKLREEIEKIKDRTNVVDNSKQIKEEPMIISQPSIKEGPIQIKSQNISFDTPIIETKSVVESIPTVTNVDPYSIIKEFKEELNRNREELQKIREEREVMNTQKEKEIERITESYQNRLEEKEKALNNENNNNIIRIQLLEERIKEKDLLLEKMNQDVKRLTEDDIIDPEFKRKIRVIRDMKKELNERFEKEEQAFKENIIALKDKISAKQLEVDGINDKIFQLEVEYKEKRDFSSASKDVFEKSKGKLFVELQLHQENLHGLEEDLQRLNNKYEAFIAKKDSDVASLNDNEIKTVEYYLAKLRQDYTYGVNYRKYKATEMERDDLQKQLGDLKSNMENDESKDNEEEKEETLNDSPELEEPKVEESNADELKVNKEQVNNQIQEAENEIRELTGQYNEFYNKLMELKSELDKRVEYEKRLRSQDEDVYEYFNTKVNLEESLADFQNKSQLGEEKQVTLASLNMDANSRTEQLKLRAEIQDIEVHKDDLRSKIDFFKNRLTELEKKEKVKTYLSIIAQMDKIRAVIKQQREEAEKIKSSVKDKTVFLENLRKQVS